MLNISCLSIWLWLMARGDCLFYCANSNLQSSFATKYSDSMTGKKPSVTQRFLFFHAQRFLLFVLHQHAMPHASIHRDEPRQTAAVSSLSINEVHLHHQRKKRHSNIQLDYLKVQIPSKKEDNNCARMCVSSLQTHKTCNECRFKDSCVCQYGMSRWQMAAFFPKKAGKASEVGWSEDKSETTAAS